ncbi:MAG: zinc ribbon domain-containing protein [Lachnospiraceae bacterium]|nr:zinc ribbon domain-containing protein [Lachnospiraceae bacterium]
MFCGNCGKNIDDGEKYCKYCGKEVTANTEADLSKPQKGLKLSKPVIAVCAGVVFLILVFLLVLIIPRLFEEDRTDDNKRERAEREYDTEDSKTEETETAENEIPSVDETIDEEITEPEELPAGENTLLIYAVDASDPDVTEKDAYVSVVDANGKEVGISDSGYARIENLPEGKYSVKIDYTGKDQNAGFFSREVVVNLDQEEQKEIIPMVHYPATDDAYVLICWKGDQNLDGCIFNSRLNCYVNKANAQDDELDYLVADRNEDYGFELMRISRIYNRNAKSVYVMDRHAVWDGTASDMEKDGVEIFVYDSYRMMAHITADETHDEPLWRPFYMYNGQVMTDENGEYISDLKNEKWTSLRAADQKIK